jgi:hypothetical protein
MRYGESLVINFHDSGFSDFMAQKGIYLTNALDSGFVKINSSYCSSLYYHLSFIPISKIMTDACKLCFSKYMNIKVNQILTRT